MQKTEKNIRKNKNTRKVKNKLNKNILLIANGESILKNNLGNKIDQYDCVVRFNDFIVENNESKIGSKINYWILNENNFSNILENNYETIVNNKIILLIAINYDNSSYYNDLLQHIKNVSLKIIKDKSELHKKPIIKIIPKKYSLYLPTWVSYLVLNYHISDVIKIYLIFIFYVFSPIWVIYLVFVHIFNVYIYYIRDVEWSDVSLAVVM